ncbi:WD and tetratricopeptide repeats protein 1 [Marchantia polymorpha subsp. ruderalis]|uniref:Anaphase-promoting complex subunit 4 WD40 domain-containing protein n=2 Tax=Marchantia polymorpha TaxID=3197 RepID=A0AAF6AL34_MARPO|nr:hypothetical protein MARPO_0005s0266 [Marchantia polymorpha]BBM97154.1 hypothetical protein Mp_1g03410 [Marchantia polymorpha subsp. ruderalis]|eukprot:PTQ48651.1 hypothetical protein MARPO_0005s0266 [Marchantia polymorpha]
MKQVRCGDGNILGLLDGRTIDSQQVPHHYQEQHFMRSVQMHSSLVHRLEMDDVMEGHQGCVNTLAWNAKGSLLLSGSDDTKVNIWDYGSRKLVHDIYTGHSGYIFCTKFMPETGDDLVVSGAGDSEVRVHRVSRLAGGKGGRKSSSDQTAVFRCHSKRVKKLAVEDGNPHVIWSASEDGTLRQHDLREGIACPPHGSPPHDCRNVLLDLRCAAKKALQAPPRHCLELKTCALSPTRPNHLLIGGSDAFARLYDRRMLPHLSSAQQPSKPPPCVCYFCPAHLSDKSRSSLHLTHVTFSPSGEEVLLSYSGEHVYLMDAFTGQEDGVVYRASDVPKRTVLAPIVNGTNVQSKSPGAALGNGYRRGSSWVQECRELFEEAKKALTTGNSYLYAVEASSEIIDAGGTVIGNQLRHDCLCLRASAFLKRKWKNDLHMAIRDCNEARAIDPMSPQAHHHMAEALSSLLKHKEALDFAIRAHQLEPSDVRLSEHVALLRSMLKTDEDSKNNRNNDGDVKLERKASRNTEADLKLERKASRLRTISNLLFRSESDLSEGYQDTWRGERGDLFNDDMEMEMEIEMSVGEEDDRDGEQGVLPGSSLNLRLRPKVEGRERTNRVLSSGSTTSTSGANYENFAVEGEIAVDMRQRYVGHCNTGTDIKQASFLGEKGEFVASGSDDGRWFIWVKKTGRLVKMLVGDEDVVNCVQCHPFDCAVATSGLDNTIKMWAPTSPRRAGGMSMVGEEAAEFTDPKHVMDINQRNMHRQNLPMEFLHRFRVQESTEGASHPFECTQS